MIKAAHLSVESCLFKQNFIVYPSLFIYLKEKVQGLLQQLLQ